MPRILLQQGTNLVNKFALLLHKCRFAQDSRDKPENDGSSRCWLSICCSLFNHPLPDTTVSTDKPSKGLDVVRQYAALLERRVQSSTRVRKAQVVTRQTNPIGRSMIEMLGVLAIIAVLSVGGIAGYSKAMEMYKINKMTEEYSYLIAGLLDNIGSIKKLNSDKNHYGLVDYVQAANLVPETWKKNSGADMSYQMTDTYGNIVQIFARTNSLVIDLYLGGFQLNTDNKYASLSFSPKVCFSLMQNVVQPLSSALDHVFLQWGTNYYGDAFCTEDRLCLKDLTLDKIRDMCNYCTKQAGDYCGITMEF